MISLPNDTGVVHMARSLGDLVGKVSLLMKLDADNQRFRGLYPLLESGQRVCAERGQGYTLNTLSTKRWISPHRLGQ